jgi:alanine dehydrogenase
MNNKIKVGLLKETKNPPDKRCAFTPNTAAKLVEKYPNIEFVIQPSDLRAFRDDEYTNKELKMQEDLSDCDVLLGVKEVKIPTLIENKTYIFFAHIAKMQSYNKSLLKAFIDKKITLIDYEYLTDKNGMRLVAFGKWAGVVGAYNGLRAWGLRSNDFHIKPAFEYLDKIEMYENIKNLKLKPIKIVITGGGRVANGAIETLLAFGIKEVTPNEFLEKTYDQPVFTKIEPWNYVKHKENKPFELNHFFKNPSEYDSIFEPYTKVADIYIACHFWDPKSPSFITNEMSKKNDFKIKVIADVSCDINIPICSTLRASTIAEPFYDYNPFTEKEEPAFSNNKNISVMAIDNLPGELPRDSSDEFSNNLINNTLDSLFLEDKDEIIKRATIVYKGTLTEKYKYLENWVNS